MDLEKELSTEENSANDEQENDKQQRKRWIHINRWYVLKYPLSKYFVFVLLFVTEKDLLFQVCVFLKDNFKILIPPKSRRSRIQKRDKTVGGDRVKDELDMTSEECVNLRQASRNSSNYVYRITNIFVPPQRRRSRNQDITSNIKNGHKREKVINSRGSKIKDENGIQGFCESSTSTKGIEVFTNISCMYYYIR